MTEEKKYKVVNIMFWNEHEEDDETECMSLSDEFTKLICLPDDSPYYPDQNKYIGKPRYYYITLKDIKKHIYSKVNVDLFCKENPECYGKEFWIDNDDPDWLNTPMEKKYIPQPENESQEK